MNHISPIPMKPERSRERGAVLIVSLIMLLVMTLLGVSSMSSTTLQERMAGNLRVGNLALQAAEAALRDGEEFLEQATLPPFTGADGLILRQDDGGQAEFWSSYNWAASSRTGTALAGVATPPQYVIEELPPVPAPGASLKFGALSEASVYRITARGTGGSGEAVRILQTTYRR